MYAWSPALAFPYETTWSILQKLTLLNHAKPLPLLREVCTTHISVQQYYSDSWRSHTFANTEWVRVGARRYAGLPPVSVAGMAVQDELLRHGGQAYLGSLATRLLTRTLRVCPECIALGFHCIAHQVEGLCRCPIHGTELISACSSCGASLLTFEPCAGFRAFKCPSCKKNLIHDTVPRPPGVEVRKQVVTHVKPLIAWLHSFEAEHIAWPATVDDLPLRTEIGESGSATSFRAGIVWAFHAYRPYQGDVTSFGPAPRGFSLKSTGSLAGLDVWGNGFRDLSRAEMQKRVETMRAFVVAVIKEERRTIMKAAKKYGVCCEAMYALLQALTASQGEAFVSPSDGYCGFVHMFHLWEFFLQRGLDTLRESVRSGWAPTMDAFYRDVIRHDVRSILSMSMHRALRDQIDRDAELGAVRHAFKLGRHPLFSINGERSDWSYRRRYGPSALVFSWDDDAPLEHLRCDHAKALDALRKRRSDLMEGMEDYRERKRTENSDIADSSAE